MDRVMRWLERNRDELVPFDTSILDLGCGNGKACLELAAEGYKDVTGVDYCHEAIDLASKLAEKHKIDNVAFKVIACKMPLTLPLVPSLSVSVVLSPSNAISSQSPKN